MNKTRRQFTAQSVSFANRDDKTDNTWYIRLMQLMYDDMLLLNIKLMPFQVDILNDIYNEI